VMSACRETSGRHGAVLLLVLLVIVVLAPVLASAAQRTIAAHAQSQDMHADLQHRWASISITDAVLDAELMAAQDPPRPEANVGFSVLLGGVRCDVRVSDEQAKANVNTLLETIGASRVQSKLRSLSDAGHSIRLTPLPKREGRARLQTYAQIFETSDPEELIRIDGGEGLADPVTCWSSGLLNISRSTTEAAHLVLGSALGNDSIGQLLETLRTQPDASIEDVLLSAGADAESIEDAMKLVTTESSSTGVMVRTSRDGLHPRYRWTVRWSEPASDSAHGGQTGTDDEKAIQLVERQRVLLW